MRRIGMIDKEWINNLVDDIIEQNCIGCDEFCKPLSSSFCWCDVIRDIVDQELYKIDECTEDNEDEVALKWESSRGNFMNSRDKYA
jgi:hypothetical protein